MLAGKVLNWLELNVLRGADNGAGILESVIQHVDRRGQYRIAAHWIIRLVRTGQKSVEACTVNVSSAGFCCLCPEPFFAGETLIALLEIPELGPDRQLETLVLRCEVVVLRAEVLVENSQWRVAGRILDYSVLSSGSATSSFSVRYQAVVPPGI